MRIRHHIFCFFLFICIANILVAQSKKNSNGIAIKITLSRIIRTNNDLKVKIIVKNISDNLVTTYKDLVAGDLENQFANLNLIVEKKKADRFIEYSRGAFFDSAPVQDTIDNIRKVNIAPNDSVRNYYHVDNEYQFEIGDYRMKCFYRNNILSKERIESNWVYFKVVRKIYVKHYFNELPPTDSARGMQ